jgi:hypothetical protein
VSTRGSSSAEISLRITALVRGTLVMVMVEWQRRTEKKDGGVRRESWGNLADLAGL